MNRIYPLLFTCIVLHALHHFPKIILSAATIISTPKAFFTTSDNCTLSENSK